ncbi:hypothetical protein NSU_3561 [Novosphingobium pentaromativorans US6-1]|uniref:Uncharacterized protein n=1 Tax=Novosphingobium pentaromativorans US6-1 TaxID=1088721 RepID=G6EGU0_9SPHN|nr:hypothetical protein NSU_3561 [Novosphingobium pentaromativorans US6-1]
MQAAAVVLAPLGMPTLAQVHAALGGPGCWLKRSRKGAYGASCGEQRHKRFGTVDADSGLMQRNV